MKTWSIFGAAIAALLFVVAGVVRGAEAAGEQELKLDDALSLTLSPELRNAAAPDWVKPGVQLGFHMADATIQGSRFGYVRDDEGGFEDPKTKKKYRQFELAGASGHGVAVITIAAVEKNAVVLHTNTSLFGPAGPLMPLTGQTGAVVWLASANSLWIGPDVLRKLPEMEVPAGMQVLRGPWELNGTRYKAIIISLQADTSSWWRVYDQETGILLRAGAQVATPPPRIQAEGDVANGGKGVTLTTFLGKRTPELPWLKSAAPGWMGEFHRLHYRGVQASTMPGGEAPITINIPCEYVFEAKRRRPGWCETAVTFSTSALPGLPGTSVSEAWMSSGVSLMGLCVPPDGLAKLRPGQELDRNPYTGYVYTVAGLGKTANGRALVTIREQGRLHTTDFSYDAQTGILQGIHKLDQSMQVKVDRTDAELVGAD